MENTTNYGLRKYQSGDLFNPLTVSNPNLDDIDTDMKAISDRAIGRATELVSQGVHAITLLDTDCKTFKFVATGNYSAGETFTVNGIQCNAYTPSGSALTSNAFVTGSIVLGALNEDGTAITFYVTGSAVADDSLKLGGELPSYYATQSDMTDVETDITNLKKQAGNTSIAGIGDGTLSGAVSSLNNDLSEVKNVTQLYTFTGASNETIASFLIRVFNSIAKTNIINYTIEFEGDFFRIQRFDGNGYWFSGVRVDTGGQVLAGSVSLYFSSSTGYYYYFTGSGIENHSNLSASNTVLKIHI